jgi:AraC-like DNA-binding protein
MSVLFEFELGKGFHFSSAFGERFNVPVSGERVYLPEILGDGFIQEVRLRNGLALCLHNYILKENLILRRQGTGSSEMLTIKFDCRRLPVKLNAEPNEPLFNGSKGCEVEFGTGNFFTELNIPPGQAIVFLVIGTSRSTLLDLLGLGPNWPSMEQMLKDNKSFVLHEGMTLDMERTLIQIGQVNQTTPLSSLHYQTKALELIHQLFTKLLTRPEIVPVALHQEDADKIYAIRATIVHDLSVTPVLTDLAAKAGMSLTKMKLLFHQIFGKSIYNYYQSERMDEAAQLLNHLTVSEAGYKVGFTNLSHFTRLFEKHNQIKPKRYKDTLKNKLVSNPE